MGSPPLQGPAPYAPLAGLARGASRRLWANQHAGATLTVLVMLGMLLASPVLAVMSGQGAGGKPVQVIVDVQVTFDRRLSGDRVR